MDKRTAHYDVGDRIVNYNDDGSLKRDMTLTGIEIITKHTQTSHPYKYNTKYYRYHCNICGWDSGKIRESSLKKQRGCRCCDNHVVVRGINDVATTHPDTVKYFVNTEEAYENTHGTQKSTEFKCPCCGYTKILTIGQVTSQGFSCPQCSDGLSYPEKYFAAMLMQLKVEFKTQLSASTYDWCGKYKYDFYLPEYNCIVETHGKQHYKESFALFGEKSLKEEQENDKTKQQLALTNGITHYVVLNCQYSDSRWIKESIEKSILCKLLNLTNVDWNACDIRATKSLVLDVCKKWTSGKYQTTNELTQEYPLCRNTIVSYLKRGTKLGWCHYDPKKEMSESCRKNGKALGKPIHVYKNNVLIHTADSAQELSRSSVDIIGKFMYQADISKICNGSKPQWHDIVLRYADYSSETAQ